MSENNSSSPMAFTSVLALIFITLKLTNYISWSWWWVLAPIYVPILITIIAIAILFLVGGGDWVRWQLRKKW